MKKHERIVCISGKAGSGKDTFAQFMKEELENNNKKVLIVHNADLIKYICLNFCAWNGVKDEAGRTLLQTFGTNIVRDKYDEDFWVRKLELFIQLSSDIIQYDYIIIPDCRYVNEVDYWLKNGYHVYYFPIVRTGEYNNLTEAQKNHSSETSLNENYFTAFSPFTVFNNNGLDELKCVAIQGVREIIKNEVIETCISSSQKNLEEEHSK